MSGASVISSSITFPMIKREFAPSVETDTGLVFEGKKVFSRRFTGVGLSNTTVLATSITDGRLVDVWGYIERSDGVQYQFICCLASTNPDENILYFDNDDLKTKTVGIFSNNPYDCVAFYTKNVVADSYDGAQLISTSVGIPLFHKELGPSVKTDSGYTWNGSTVYYQRFTGTSDDGSEVLRASPSSTNLLQVIGTVFNGSSYHTFPQICTTGASTDQATVVFQGAFITLFCKGDLIFQPYDIVVYWTE